MKEDTKKRTGTQIKCHRKKEENENEIYIEMVGIERGKKKESKKKESTRWIALWIGKKECMNG